MPSGIMITDPNEIKKYEALDTNAISSTQKNPTPSAQSGVLINDPDEIAKYNNLDGLQNSSTPSLFSQTEDYIHNIPNILHNMAGYATSAEAGPIRLFKEAGNVLNSGLNKGLGLINQKWSNTFPQMNFNPENVAQNLSGASIPQNMTSNAIENLSEIIPGMVLTPELSESTISQLPNIAAKIGARIGGQILPQAGLGALMTPQNRLTGAEFGGIGRSAEGLAQGLGNISGKIDEWAYPKQFTKNLSDKIQNFFQSQKQNYESGYKNLTNYKNEPILNLGMTKEDLERQLQNQKNISAQNYQDYQNAPTRAQASENFVKQNIFNGDPQAWEFFEKNIATPRSDISQKLKAFYDDPSAQRANDLKQAFSTRAFNEKNNGNSGNYDLLQGMKNDFIDNIISPFLDSKNPGSADAYKFADRLYNSQKTIFNNQDLENLAKGRIKNIDPNRLKALLQKSSENGELQEAPFMETGYQKLRMHAQTPGAKLMDFYGKDIPSTWLLNKLTNSRAIPFGFQFYNLEHPYG